MAAALAVEAASDGAFDPTLGRCAALRWDAAQCTPMQPGGLWLDLGGIAKGHAVDRLSRRLTVLGLPDHLVEVGGELVVSGLRRDFSPAARRMAGRPGEAGENAG